MSDKMSLWLDGGKVAGRLLLAGTFAWACVHKIAEPFDFALQVATYQILPLSLINLMAIVLPWLEAVLAVLLVLGLWTRASSLVTAGLNLMFIVAIGMALHAKLHLQCGCFASEGAGEEMDASLIVRDVGLLLVCVFLLFAKPDRWTLDRFLGKERHS
ncbi:MAG: DoxX family membrane protein [Myxococcota bacterium]|jgi:uncharacterized membrane protein YphA (DoxX/SURF4 family)|nr:DoxX family membrane protein [Myxococcota bacterium]